MTATASVIRIDARGQRCPWPAIRLARALRDHAGPIEIIADDLAAGPELAAVASAAQAAIISMEGEGIPTFRVERGASVNNSFTRDR